MRCYKRRGNELSMTKNRYSQQQSEATDELEVSLVSFPSSTWVPPPLNPVKIHRLLLDQSVFATCTILIQMWPMSSWKHFGYMYFLNAVLCRDKYVTIGFSRRSIDLDNFSFSKSDRAGWKNLLNWNNDKKRWESKSDNVIPWHWASSTDILELCWGSQAAVETLLTGIHSPSFSFVQDWHHKYWHQIQPGLIHVRAVVVCWLHWAVLCGIDVG